MTEFNRKYLSIILAALLLFNALYIPALAYADGENYGNDDFSYWDNSDIDSGSNTDTDNSRTAGSEDKNIASKGFASNIGDFISVLATGSSGGFTSGGGREGGFSGGGLIGNFSNYFGLRAGYYRPTWSQTSLLSAQVAQNITAYLLYGIGWTLEDMGDMLYNQLSSISEDTYDLGSNLQSILSNSTTSTSLLRSINTYVYDSLGYVSTGGAIETNTYGYAYTKGSPGWYLWKIFDVLNNSIKDNIGTMTDILFWTYGEWDPDGTFKWIRPYADSPVAYAEGSTGYYVWQIYEEIKKQNNPSSSNGSNVWDAIISMSDAIKAWGQNGIKVTGIENLNPSVTINLDDLIKTIKNQDYSTDLSGLLSTKHVNGITNLYDIYNAITSIESNKSILETISNTLSTFLENWKAWSGQGNSNLSQILESALDGLEINQGDIQVPSPDLSGITSRLETIITLLGISAAIDAADLILGDLGSTANALKDAATSITSQASNVFPFCIPAVIKHVCGLMQADKTLPSFTVSVFGASQTLDFNNYNGVIYGFGNVTSWIARITLIIILMVNTKKFVIGWSGGTNA